MVKARTLRYSPLHDDYTFHGGGMNEMWHFEQDMDGGWQWIHTDLESGEVDRSASIFRTRSACMVDALGNGYVCSQRQRTSRRTATVH